MIFQRNLWTLLCIGALFLPACQMMDTGVGTTLEGDYDLSLRVENRFMHRGDQVPVTVRLKRTDNSNLLRGTVGTITLTTTVNGRVDLTQLSVDVGDDTTEEFVQVVVFTARRAGIAELRASFLDAEARVEMIISTLDL